jgi:type VI secretion system lysozyme-like protein
MKPPPSLLDRLFPPPPGARGGLVAGLERLLNARCREEFPEGFEDLAGTLPGYGLPDLAPRPDDPAGRERLCAIVRAKIEAFEPRLAGVRVEAAGLDGGVVRLRIEARLKGTHRRALTLDAFVPPGGRITLQEGQ